LGGQIAEIGTGCALQVTYFLPLTNGKPWFRGCECGDLDRSGKYAVQIELKDNEGRGLVFSARPWIGLEKVPVAALRGMGLVYL